MQIKSCIKIHNHLLPKDYLSSIEVTNTDTEKTLVMILYRLVNHFVLYIKDSLMSLRGHLRPKTGSREEDFIEKEGITHLILSFKISFLNQRSDLLLREQTNSSTSIFNFQLHKSILQTIETQRSHRLLRCCSLKSILKWKIVLKILRTD